MHLALLGDSIFDNKAYTRGEPDVVTHLRAQLPDRWQATLLALDGSAIGDLEWQLSRLPAGVTHLAVAVGGNDALRNIDLLERRVTSTRETLLLFGRRVARFEAAYRAAIRDVVATRLPAAACTIYNGRFEGEADEVVRAALTVFNDAILRVLFEARVDVIDLRLICCEASDYANPIEPSGEGGRKIADAIVRALTRGNDDPSARVFGRI
jgi:hypothetical protein